MLAQHSRQVRRRMARAAAKAADRPKQATPSWGDRRLNRQKRFAAIAMRDHLRRTGLLLRDLTEPVMVSLAKTFGLPEAFVRELSTAAGRTSLMENAA